MNSRSNANTQRQEEDVIAGTMNHLLAFVVFLGCLCRPVASRDLKWRGMDISSLEKVEAAVEQIDVSFWYEAKNKTSVPEILAKSGVNMAGLLLLVDPQDGMNNLDYTLNFVERLSSAGINEIKLNLHFSDVWSSSTQQQKPKAWESLDFDALASTVKTYTRSVMQRFLERDITITAVQLGNDIGNGILWPEGRVAGGSFEKLGVLLEHATKGIREAVEKQNAPAIVLHLNEGATSNSGQAFFDNLVQYYEGFDVIGVSYYPWVHGTIGELEQTLKDFARIYDKDAVVETAYPWTLKWNDGLPNVVGECSQLLDGFPTTEALSMLRYMLSEKLPNKYGIGMIYKDPVQIATWDI